MNETSQMNPNQSGQGTTNFEMKQTPDPPQSAEYPPVIIVQNQPNRPAESFIRSNKCWYMCLGISFIVISVVTMVITNATNLTRSSDWRHYTCQENNDTGNIFLCQFNNECIEKVFSYDEVKNKQKTGNLIHLKRLCDGSCDCIRSRCEDENEACPNLSCDGRKHGMHQCQNGRCVAFDKLCNHWDDCGDNSDESTCWSTSDGRCYIPQHSRCDGRIDCQGSWDERNC